MRVTDIAIVLTALPHGEHGAVVRLLGETLGLVAGYVAGARGRRMRALVQPGNRVSLALSGRAEGQLPAAALELVRSRALLAFAPQAAAALAWVTGMTAAALAERDPHPRLYAALDALLDGLDAGLADAALAGAVARYELLLLADCGLGLDLSGCAMGGSGDALAFVSPRSGRAVSRQAAAGQSWAGRLLPLPAFLLEQGDAVADAGTAMQGLALTGHFLRRHWLADRPALAALRARLVRQIGGTSREQLASDPPHPRHGA